MIGPLYPTVVISLFALLNKPSFSSVSKVIDGAISVPSETRILPSNLLSPTTVNFSSNVDAIFVGPGSLPILTIDPASVAKKVWL